MKLENVENVEKYASVFAKVGSKPVSPDAFYDHFELPKELRATFTIKPYNPIVREEVKQLNKKGRAASDKFLKGKGYNVFDLSSDIVGITNLFLAVSEAETDADREECNVTAKQLIKIIEKRDNSLNKLKESIKGYKSDLGYGKKSDNFDYALLTLILNKLRPINEEQDSVYYAGRDLSRLFDILIAHTDKVENLVTEVGDVLSSHSGAFGATELYSLNSDILKWLEKEQARHSSLSEKEIVGL
jgi:hypothetical protein